MTEQLGLPKDSRTTGALAGTWKSRCFPYKCKMIAIAQNFIKNYYFVANTTGHWINLLDRYKFLPIVDFNHIK